MINSWSELFLTISLEEGLMLTLTAGQKRHVAKVIMAKRKEDYSYYGGNAALAERLGVSSQLLSMWAYNKRSPSHRQLLALAETFNMSLEDLCHLKKRSKKVVKSTRNSAVSAISSENIRGSMLKICNITSELVERERQMLRGKVSYKEHNNWQKRIKEYVDTL
jgi:transcriptional regulator with XRE-family HTH domain